MLQGIGDDPAEKVKDLIEQAKALKSLPPPAVRRARRIAVGASQELFGQILGISGVTVGRYEKGERTPRGDLLRRYVELLEQVGSL